MNVKLLLFTTLPHIGTEYLGLGGVELYDCQWNLSLLLLALSKSFEFTAKARTNEYITSIGIPAVFISTPAFVDNVHAWPLVKEVDNGHKLECKLSFFPKIKFVGHCAIYFSLGSCC